MGLIRTAVILTGIGIAGLYCGAKHHKEIEEISDTLSIAQEQVKDVIDEYQVAEKVVGLRDKIVKTGGDVYDHMKDIRQPDADASALPDYRCKQYNGDVPAAPQGFEPAKGPMNLSDLEKELGTDMK